VSVSAARVLLNERGAVFAAKVFIVFTCDDLWRKGAYTVCTYIKYDFPRFLGGPG